MSVKKRLGSNDKLHNLPLIRANYLPTGKFFRVYFFILKEYFSFDILFCLNMTDQIAIIKNFCVLFSILPLELWQIRILSQYLFFLMYFPFYQHIMSLFPVTIFLLSLSCLVLAQPPQLSFGYYFHFITIYFPVFHFFKNWGYCGL